MVGRTPAQIATQEPRRVQPERHLDKGTVQGLLRAAVAKLADAQREANSGATRLETAYDAMLFCALAIFAARSYRVKSEPGHHEIALEGLGAELSLTQAVVDEIVAIQSIRHTKYTGFIAATPTDLAVAITRANAVLNETDRWFRTNAPHLLKA